MFHLQQVFHHDAGKTLKYCIINMLNKPHWVSIYQLRHYHAWITAQMLIRPLT
jgi:hypothetical protein